MYSTSTSKLNYGMAAKEKVLKKLKKHPDHKNESGKELEQLATELTTPAKIRERFAHLLHDGETLINEILEEDDEDLLHTLEIEAQHERIKHNTSKACSLPIKLSLQKLRAFPILPGMHSFAKRLKFEYGPLHSAVIVGDVVIEWGREELVEPRCDPFFVTEFQGHLQHQGEWFRRQRVIQQEMSLANRQGTTQDRVDIMCKSIKEKSQFIDRLVNVIVDYNCNKAYSVFSCNCQDFARDALAALGLKKPVVFDGKLQERFEQIKRGKVKVPHELKTHSSLDAYVQAHKDELDLPDLEYLQCLYFAEHLPKIEKSDNPEIWECGLPNCKSAELDELIRAQSIPHNQFSKEKKSSVATVTTPQLKLRGDSTSTPTGPPPPAGNSYSDHHSSSYQHQSINNGHDLPQAIPQALPCINKCGLPGDEDRAGLCLQCHELEQIAAWNETVTAKATAAVPADTNVDSETQRPCPSPGCEYYGTRDTLFYCSKCFEANNAPKCDQCNFFGSPEYNGLCYKCFLQKTKQEASYTTNNPPVAMPTNVPYSMLPSVPQVQSQDGSPNNVRCTECKSFYANEEYGNLCHGCFMFKTKMESFTTTRTEATDCSTDSTCPRIAQQVHSHAVPVRRPYVPRYQKCNTYNCNNPTTETGYCDICTPRAIPTSVQIQKETTDRSDCYLCTGQTPSERNQLCDRHFLQLKQMVPHNSTTLSQRGMRVPSQNTPTTYYVHGPSPVSENLHASHRMTPQHRVYAGGQREHQLISHNSQQTLPLYENTHIPTASTNWTRQSLPVYENTHMPSEPQATFWTEQYHTVLPTDQSLTAYENTRIQQQPQAAPGASGTTGTVQLCIMPGCFYKGYMELEQLCPNCYEEKYPGFIVPTHLPLV